MADEAMKVTLIGFDELSASLKKSSGVFQKELLKAMNQTATLVERRAAQKAPHDTGSLRDSIHSEKAVWINNNAVSKVTQDGASKTGTHIEYGFAQEYGTEGMQINGKSKLGKAFTYIGNIKPKFYMRDARNESMPDLTQYVADAMQRIIKKVTGH